VTEYEFRVRWYQRAFHEALVNRTHDRLIAIWHRRAGKDEIVLNAMRELAWKNPGTYWHCFPEQKQARKAIWNGVNGHTGKRRILEAFPPALIKRMQDDDMFIELVNGATFQLIGSDRYDSTVGSGPKGIAYSEWALSNPAAWAYHSPMIRESKGFAAFITTPRGNNHAKTMYEREYLCSFAGAMIGAYWGAEMAVAEREKRIGVVPVDREHPVHTAWDLGKAVNNPIWCFQVIAGRLKIVDFYRPESDDLTDWIKWLEDRAYHGDDYVPDDVMDFIWGAKHTRWDLLKAAKRKPKLVKRIAVAEGIHAGREAIKVADFDAERCELGIEGLKNYRREWDDELKTFRENPVKDWAEHIGSSWRYLGLAWRDQIKREPPKPKPTELIYEARPDGSVVGNMSVKAAVDAMIKRRKAR
jgi:phage terminase large subunit